MSRRKPRKALKDPNTVHQVRPRDGRVVEWTGNDDSPLREALATSPGRGGPAKRKKQRKKGHESIETTRIYVEADETASARGARALYRRSELLAWLRRHEKEDR
jgi:hypothetical protein